MQKRKKKKKEYCCSVGLRFIASVPLLVQLEQGHFLNGGKSISSQSYREKEEKRKTRLEVDKRGFNVVTYLSELPSSCRGPPAWTIRRPCS